MNLLIHVEQYDVLGILPSQLESLTLLCSAIGVNKKVFIDSTVDGVERHQGWERYTTIQQWLSSLSDGVDIVVFSPGQGTNIHNLSIQEDTWLIFGPSMGWHQDDFATQSMRWANIPGGTMNSRDAVPIALWEMA